jgi:putative transposon-encoded protein
MVALKTEKGLQEIGGGPEESCPAGKAKFVVFGQEMIEKQVKQCGAYGRFYLPSDWVGKRVKIIRID